jgi:hypothetical protein
VAKGTHRGELENNSGKPSDLTLSQGMMKKGNVVIVADDDDEMR